MSKELKGENSKAMLPVLSALMLGAVFIQKGWLVGIAGAIIGFVGGVWASKQLTEKKSEGDK